MKIKKVFIHCSATTPDMNTTVEDIEKWHKKKGWSGIGYHWYISRDGVIHAGRDTDGDGNNENDMGAHAYGFNRDSLGVCLEGGLDDDLKPSGDYTDAQWSALKLLIIDISGRHGLNLSDFYGHNDVDKHKDCPCFDVKQKLKGLFHED